MKLSRILLFLLTGAALPMARAQETKQMTVDQLVAKNIEAKGGAEAVHALQSLKLTGKLLVNQGQLELGYTETRKRPNEVRSEYSLQGMTAVNAFDGKEGWKISPFQGRKDPEKMSADDTKSLWEDAEVAGPLVDWQEKGSKVEYLGTEDVDGTQAYKLKVTRKNGDVSFVYLDPEHFLEIRIINQRMEHGAQVQTEIDLSDYEKVDGVYVPFSVDTGHKGDPDKQKLIIDKADGNVPTDEAMFQFPTTPSK
ncbi:MAG: outer membrane lipoprotein-sorting protein [Verrucomicrobiota bacterium]|nr:outer membrane lipoprotein-sorting protein [Verrucomicrobiota bacterium]